MKPRRRLAAVFIVMLLGLSSAANLAACNSCQGSRSRAPAHHACCGMSGQCCCNPQEGQAVEARKAHSPLCVCSGQLSDRSEAVLAAAEGETRPTAFHQAEALIAPAPSLAPLRAAWASEEQPPPGFMLLLNTSTTSRSPPTA